jgi:pimeloyl-ACP methyl ester carboxylesterase
MEATNPANLTDEAIEYYFTPLVSSPLRRMQLNRHSPTRMVWGTADKPFPVVWAEWLDRTIPGSRGVRLVDGGKLFWPEELPDLIAEELEALWSV